MTKSRKAARACPPLFPISSPIGQLPRSDWIECSDATGSWRSGLSPGLDFSEAQLSDHLHRIEISQGFEDIPALFSDGGDDGAKDGEVVGGKGKNKHADKKLKTGRGAVSKLRSGGTPPRIIVSTRPLSESSSSANLVCPIASTVPSKRRRSATWRQQARASFRAAELVGVHFEVEEQKRQHVRRRVVLFKFRHAFPQPAIDFGHVLAQPGGTGRGASHSVPTIRLLSSNPHLPQDRAAERATRVHVVLEYREMVAAGQVEIVAVEALLGPGGEEGLGLAVNSADSSPPSVTVSGDARSGTCRIGLIRSISSAVKRSFGCSQE